MMERAEKEIKKFWEEASVGYQKDSGINTRSAHYGPYSPNENKLKLLGKIKGKKILEIGCGGGQCSIAFAKKGAKCIGIDISEKQLEYAKKLAKKNKVKIDFRLGTFQDLSKINSKSQDIVFSAFALQYSSNLKSVFKQVHRVLKPKGLFVFSFDHPFYTSLSPKTFKIDKNYNKSGKYTEIETWPDGSKHKFVMCRRKISEIYDDLLNAGFFVDKIIEPFDMKTEKAWKNKGIWKEIYPPKLVKLVGPTIIFKARKK